MVGANPNPAPSPMGVHRSIMIPFGTYTKPRRTGGFAAVPLPAASAGTMASSSGRASVVLRLRRNVRRGNDFLVMIIFRKIVTASHVPAQPQHHAGSAAAR